MISPEIFKVVTSALVCMCLTLRYRLIPYMVDLDLLSRSPEVIDLLGFSNGTTRYRSSLNVGDLDLHQGHWRSLTFLFFLS
jgi:hypothetical protein